MPAHAPNYRWFTDGQLNVSWQLPRCAARAAPQPSGADLRGREAARCAASPTASCMPRSAASAMRCAQLGVEAAAIASSSTCRWCPRPSSPCTPARASAPSTRWCSAASRRCRCATASRMPARASSSPPMAAIAAARWWSSRPPPTRRCPKAPPAIEKVIVLKHTGLDVPMQPGRDLWWHDVVAGPAVQVRARLGRCRASAVPALYLRLHRQAQGHPAFQRRLPAGREAHLEVGVRPQARGRLLVHGRCGLGHRPQLCGLWAASPMA